MMSRPQQGPYLKTMLQLSSDVEIRIEQHKSSTAQ